MSEPTYLYERVFERLLEQREGLKAPLRLPDEHRLAEQYSVGRETIRRALKLLEQQNAITRSPRVGTFLQPLRSTTDALRGKHVGLMPPWWMDSTSAWLTSSLFEGISRWADEHGAMISVLHSQELKDEQVSASHRRALRKRLVDRELAGLIWMHPQRWQMSLVEAAAGVVPTVVVGRPSTAADLCHVVPDFEQAAQLIDDYLVQQGHLQYAVIGKNAMEPFTQAWIGAFDKAQQKRGRHFNERREFVDLSSLETKYLTRLLLEFYEPAHRGIKCYVLLTSTYLSDLVPERRFRDRASRDLSLVSWDYGKYPIDAYWPGRRVTHVSCDWVEMGRVAMQVLAKLVANGQAGKVTKLPVQFDAGDTVYSRDGVAPGVEGLAPRDG